MITKEFKDYNQSVGYLIQEVRARNTQLLEDAFAHPSPKPDFNMIKASTVLIKGDELQKPKHNSHCYI